MFVCWFAPSCRQPNRPRPAVSHAAFSTTKRGPATGEEAAARPPRDRFRSATCSRQISGAAPMQAPPPRLSETSATKWPASPWTRSRPRSKRRAAASPDARGASTGQAEPRKPAAACLSPPERRSPASPSSSLFLLLYFVRFFFLVFFLLFFLGLLDPPCEALQGPAVEHVRIHHADQHLLDGSVAEPVDYSLHSASRDAGPRLGGPEDVGPAVDGVGDVSLVLQPPEHGAYGRFLRLAGKPLADGIRGGFTRLPHQLHDLAF